MILGEKVFESNMFDFVAHQINVGNKYNQTFGLLNEPVGGNYELNTINAVLSLKGYELSRISSSDCRNLKVGSYLININKNHWVGLVREYDPGPWLYFDSLDKKTT